MRKSLLLCSLVITSLLFINSLSCYSKESVCFKDVQFEKRLNKSTFDEPIGEIKLIVPQEVGFGSRYNLLGSWGKDYSYKTGTYIVAGGWVDDESDTSQTFFKTGSFNQRFLDVKDMVNARTFDIDLIVPKDEYAKTHKFLKIQISVSASGDNTQFLKSWIYKIPVVSFVRGEILQYDVDMKTGETNTDELFGKNIVVSLLEGDNIINTATLSDQNCYTVSVDSNKSQKVTIGTTHMGLDSYPLISYKYKDVPVGTQISTWFPREIYKKHTEIMDSLSHVKLKANIFFDIAPLSYELYTYHFLDVQDVFSKFRIYETDYDDYLIGKDNDSLRAEILTRFLIAENAAFRTYYPFHNLCGETMKTLYTLVESIFLIDELRELVKKIEWKNKISVNASDLIMKQIFDAIMSSIMVSVDNFDSRIVKSQLKPAIKAMTTTVSVLCGSGARKAVYTTLAKEGLANLALLSGNIIVIPQYVKYNEYYLNPAAKYYLANYPNMPEENTEKYNLQGTASEAAAKILGTSDTTQINKMEVYTNNLIIATKNARNTSKVYDAITALSKIGERLVLGAAAAAVESAPALVTAVIVLQGIKLYDLMSSLILDVGTLDQYFWLSQDVVWASFNPNHKFTDTGWASNRFNKNLDIPLSKNSNLIKNYGDDLVRISNSYTALMDEIVNDFDAGNKANAEIKLNELLIKDDSLFSAMKLARESIYSVLDTARKIDTTFRDNFLQYIDLMYANSTARQHFNMYSLSLILGASNSIDTLKESSKNIKILLSGFLKMTEDFAKKISNLTSPPFLVITSFGTDEKKIEKDKAFVVKLNLKNIGSTSVNNIKLQLTTDTNAVVNPITEISESKLDPGKEKTFQWNITHKAPVANIGSYIIEIASENANELMEFRSYTLDSKQIFVHVDDEPSAKNEFMKIVPNPNNGIINLTFNEEVTSDVTIELYDMKGRIFFEKQIIMNNSHLPLDLSAFDSGSYILSVSYNNKQITRIIQITK